MVKAIFLYLNKKSYAERLCRKIRAWHTVRTIKKSGLFFVSYYLKRYPDVASSRMNPIKHYVYHGASEGRNPNPIFNTLWYVEQYEDVNIVGINPLAHYIRFGWKEGRNPSQVFRTIEYLNNNNDVREAHINPLYHYLRYGVFEGRNPF